MVVELIRFRPSAGFVQPVPLLVFHYPGGMAVDAFHRFFQLSVGREGFPSAFQGQLFVVLGPDLEVDDLVGDGREFVAEAELVGAPGYLEGHGVHLAT